MHTRSASKGPKQRRRVDLFEFGHIEYEPGPNYVNGSFEMTAFPVAPYRAGSTSEENAARWQSRQRGEKSKRG